MAASFSDCMEKTWAGAASLLCDVTGSSASSQGRAGGLQGRGSGPRCAELNRWDKTQRYGV